MEIKIRVQKGDLNTKFFHTSIRGDAIIGIAAILDCEGSRVEDPKVMFFLIILGTFGLLLTPLIFVVST